MQPPVPVSIVEDDHRIRGMLEVLLDGAPGFRLAASYPDAESALDALPGDGSRLVLMDIGLPGMDGIEAVRRLARSLPDRQVVMLTLYEDPDRVFEALKAGAVGYLVKMTPPHAILEALQEVAQGGSPMSPSIARQVVRHFHQPARPAELDQLTARESQILDLLARGYQYKEIGSELFISANTVHNHLRKIYAKLQVRGKAEAILVHRK